MENPFLAALASHHASVEVTAVVLDLDMIRLKFLNLPDDKGPELIMNFDLARNTIAALLKCLPENKIT